MKFSRNPITGEMETYSDEGMFAGHVFTMADLIRKKGESAEDGGPGSGNFGHKGRPGKRGGSGPGGGKQYRGGRADIGYFNSRKDWLNGLSGEKQHEAARYIAETKKNLNAKVKARQEIESLQIPEDQKKELLKRGKLENVQESMTPEEYLMKNGSAQETHYLLSMAKQARSWDETKDRLIKDNLSDEEQAFYNALVEKWDDTDKIYAGETWKALLTKEQLEAKAMGLVDFDIDMPDEIQYRLGTKERPAPPEPEGPDYSWLDNKENWKSRNIDTYMSIALGESPDYMKELSKEEFAELNQRFLDKLKYGTLTSTQARNAKSALYRMRERMYPSDPYLAGGSDGYHYTPASFQNLSDQEKDRMVQIANVFSPSFVGVSSVDEINDQTITNIESAISSAPLRTKEERKLVQDYVLMQEKILGGYEPSDHDTLAEKKEQQKTVEEQIKEAKRQTIAEEQKAFRESDDAKKKAELQKKVSSMSFEDPQTQDSGMVVASVNNSGLLMSSYKMKDLGIGYNQQLDVANAVKDVVTAYPFLAGEIGAITDEEKRDSTFACCSMNSRSFEGEIRINPKKFADEEQANSFRKSSERAGYKVVTDDGVSAVRASVTHEMGHKMSNWLHRVVYGGDFPYKEKRYGMVKRLDYYTNVEVEIQNKVLRALKLKKADIGKEVSSYAATSPAEFFAECFCESMCSSKPRRVAVEFKKQLDSFMKEHGIDDMSTALTKSAEERFLTP